MSAYIPAYQGSRRQEHVLRSSPLILGVFLAVLDSTTHTIRQRAIRHERGIEGAVGVDCLWLRSILTAAAVAGVSLAAVGWLGHLGRAGSRHDRWAVGGSCYGEAAFGRERRIGN